MPNPHEILTQLLSPAQADALDRGGRDAWNATATALGAILGAPPKIGEVDARLVMPEEIVGEFAEPHLVAPIELSTDQEQTACAYLTFPTPVAALFFDSQADDPGDEEQQTFVLTSTVLGQVLQALNIQLFGASPSGLVLSLDEISANTMPRVLATLNEPAMALAGSIDGGKLLSFSMVLPGTFLDVISGSLPAAGAAATGGASAIAITQEELEMAEIVEVEPIPAPTMVAVGAGRHPEPAAIATPPREPTPISQAPAASRARFTPLPESRPAQAPQPIDLLRDLEMNVTVELGRTELTVADVLDLGPGSVIELDRIAGEPVDILVNDRIVARGEIVVVDENFGVRVVEVVRRGSEATGEAM